MGESWFGVQIGMVIFLGGFFCSLSVALARPGRGYGDEDGCRYGRMVMMMSSLALWR